MFPGRLTFYMIYYIDIHRTSTSHTTLSSFPSSFFYYSCSSCTTYSQLLSLPPPTSLSGGSVSRYCSPRQKKIVFLKLSFSLSYSSATVLGRDLSIGSFSISWTLAKRDFLSWSEMGGIMGYLTPSYLGTIAEGHQNFHSSPQNKVAQLVRVPRLKGLGWLPSLSFSRNVPFIISILVTFLVREQRLLKVSPSMLRKSMKAAAVRNIQVPTSPSVKVLTPELIIRQYLQMEMKKNWKAKNCIVLQLPLHTQ